MLAGTSSRWKVKALVQKAIASLPGRVSLPLYYLVQRRFGNLRQVTPVEHFRNALWLLRALKESGYSIDGRTIFEVGTGRTLNLPIAMWLCGASKVVTHDVNPYLKSELIDASLTYMQHNSAEIVELFGEWAATSCFQSRFAALMAVPRGLQELLKLTGIQYFAPADARRTPLPDAAIDCHLSSTVLEHVAREDIRAIFVEARRVLRPSGVMAHCIDLSDHFAAFDSALNKLNFLQFSDAEWGFWANNRFMYQNRLRASDYKLLFEQVGVKPLWLRCAVDTGAAESLRNSVGINSRFAGLPVDDLATTGLTFVGRFS